MSKKKKNIETKSYIPPLSPVAIQPGDSGFKIVGKAYNRWIGTFKDWKKKKGGIVNPDTTWDMNKKPLTKSEIKNKYKTLHLKKKIQEYNRFKGSGDQQKSLEIENAIDDKEIHESLLKTIPSDSKKSTKIIDKPGSAKIYPYLDVDARKKKKGKKNLENLKDYRDWLSENKKYTPRSEYKEETRKDLNLDLVRKTAEYEQLIELGFKENTSHQQELNNTMRFERKRERQKKVGYSKVFYTIHPTGVVRRYNPEKGEEVPEGSGNVIKKFSTPFETPKEYKKGLLYLWQYLRRKENRGDYR